MIHFTNLTLKTLCLNNLWDFISTKLVVVDFFHA